VPIRTGSDEIHIVGDVAWAACFYADWTGDEVFASGPGLRILIETARYWSSRVRVDRDGRAHLYGVIGPDEYHEPVDDNMFTNVLARWNLRRAATAAEWYGDPDVQPGEAARWQQIADALVDGYSPERGVYEQFAGFFGLEPVLVAEVAPRRPITADLLLGRERVRGAQIIKQADVLMAYHLLPDEVAPELLESNLDFYEPRTAHGSSLSPAMHASVMARAGRMDDAVDCLRLAAGIDVYDLTSTGAGGVHIAAMGGVWQAIAFGFMGLRAHGDALIVDPKIPRQWNSLGMHVFYRGVPLSLRADAEALQLRAEGRVTIEYRGRRRAFEAGEHVIPLASGGAQ
jgi:trehalose/maltose hydrolase-like predicted phosphorylase